MIFLEKLRILKPSSLKYFSIYEKLILRAMSRPKTRKACNKLFGYVELHHIFPKSLCLQSERTNPNNLVYLTFKEHLLCHKILAKCFGHIKTFIRAYYAMFTNRNNSQIKRPMTIREAEFFKLNSNIHSRCGPLNGMYNKKHSEETKQKISKSNTGKFWSNEEKIKMSQRITGGGNPFYGKTHSQKTKTKISNAVSSSIQGNKNPSAKTFEFINPESERFIITGEFIKFCKSYGLSPSRMKRELNNGKIKPNPKYPTLMSEQTKKCIGWEVRIL